MVEHDVSPITPNQLVPKRGSQRSLSYDPNLTWWAYRGTLSIVQAWDILNRESIPLFSPAFDRASDPLQLIRATLIFKMNKVL